MTDIQGILEWIDNCGNGVMNVGAMRDLAAAYREMREIAGTMAQILERRVEWEHAGDILNRYEEAIK
jgi:hypothetical protein